MCMLQSAGRVTKALATVALFLFLSLSVCVSVSTYSLLTLLCFALHCNGVLLLLSLLSV